MKASFTGVLVLALTALVAAIYFNCEFTNFLSGFVNGTIYTLAIILVNLIETLYIMYELSI